MLSGEDYYALLRVSPDADGAVIRVAYRALMRRYHPDVSASADAAAQAKAINEAYACLRDADKRAGYDWQRAQPPRRPQATPAHPRPQRPQRPRPVWAGPAPRPEPPMSWFKPTWGKAVGLGIAGLVTAITFTITSAIPPAEPSAAEPSAAKPAVVRMRAVSTISAARGTDCRDRPTQAGSAKCTP